MVVCICNFASLLVELFIVIQPNFSIRFNNMQAWWAHISSLGFSVAQVPPEEKAMPTNKTFRGRIPSSFRQSFNSIIFIRTIHWEWNSSYSSSLTSHQSLSARSAAMGCGQLRWKVISRGKPIDYPRPLRSRFIRSFRPGRVLSMTPKPLNGPVALRSQSPT